MSTKYISDFQKPISIFLLISILFVFSCSLDNSITNNQNDPLSKPTEYDEIFSPTTDPDKPKSTEEKIVLVPLSNFIDYLTPAQQEFLLYGCLFIKLAFISDDNPSFNTMDLSEPYDFRDNFLAKSEKGNTYTIIYNILSGYGIKHNLLMKHSLKHISIMETGIGISKELQHGTNNSKILFNKSTYDDCKDIVKIYRNSEKHTDIDLILDYLEADLEKYYNKPKAEIAADFGF